MIAEISTCICKCPNDILNRYKRKDKPIVIDTYGTFSCCGDFYVFKTPRTEDELMYNVEYRNITTDMNLDTISKIFNDYIKYADIMESNSTNRLVNYIVLNVTKITSTELKNLPKFPVRFVLMLPKYCVGIEFPHQPYLEHIVYDYSDCCGCHPDRFINEGGVFDININTHLKKHERLESLQYGYAHAYGFYSIEDGRLQQILEWRDDSDQWWIPRYKDLTSYEQANKSPIEKDSCIDIREANRDGYLDIWEFLRDIKI